MEGHILIVVLSAFIVFSGAVMHEPTCSKFDYEMKTLEAMLRMEQKVEKMVEEMKIMKDSVNIELEKSKVFRDATKTELDGKVESLTQKTELSVQKVDDTLKRVEGMAVAFSVTIPTLSLVNGVPTFKEVITNIGGGYDVQTGVFTSPVDGLYSFTFTVGSEGGYQVHCRIQHNGVNKVLGLTYSDTAYTTASNSVNLLLAKGDTVRLGSCGGWDNAYRSSRGTAFSGVLVQQTTVN